MLAALLDVSVSALAGTEGVREPTVAYRVKRTRKVKEEQAAWIKRDVLWLRVLEKRMSMSGWMERPPEHRGAATDEQTHLAATSFRHELGLHDDDEVIPAHRLLSWIATHGICLVPVLWGAIETATAGDVCSHAGFGNSLAVREPRCDRRRHPLLAVA